MDNKLFIQEENLEFLYDYKEVSHLLDLFHKYIKICRDDRNYCTGCLHQTVMDTWKKYILSLAEEQYNNFKTGNFFSTAMMNRAIIESYVSVLCIKKYQEEEIWKEWYLKSYLYSLRQVNYSEKFARMYKKLCNDLGTDYEQIKN